MPSITTDLQGAVKQFGIYRTAVLLFTGSAMLEIAREVDREVVEATPVDTGRARSNWLVSVGFALDDEIEPYVPYPKFSGPKLDEKGNALAAIEQAEIAFKHFDPENPRPIYIQNNVDYIGLLNEGNQSQQCEALFVETAVMVGVERGLESAASYVEGLLG